jgi:Delta3-Delta2-enoyl-CoA isomerase
LIITGAQEKFFNTGLNLEWMMQNMAKPGVIEQFLFDMNKLFMRFCNYPKPVIAAINGHAIGNGLIMTAHMDFRLMREDRGWLNLPEVKINIPFLPGMLAIFKEVIPAKSLRDMIYLGRKYSARQGEELGFIDFVTDKDSLLPKAMELAQELTKVKMQAYAEIKRRNREKVMQVMIEEDEPALKWAYEQMKAMMGA